MSNINVKVDGNSQLNIGNLAQGRDIRISSGDLNMSESSSALVKKILDVVTHMAGGDIFRIEAVHPKVEELGKALTDEPRNNGKIKEILGIIKQHHDWAFPAISEIVQKIAPTLGALL